VETFSPSSVAFDEAHESSSVRQRLRRNARERRLLLSGPRERAWISAATTFVTTRLRVHAFPEEEFKPSRDPRIIPRRSASVFARCRSKRILISHSAVWWVDMRSECLLQDSQMPKHQP